MTRHARVDSAATQKVVPRTRRFASPVKKRLKFTRTSPRASAGSSVTLRAAMITSGSAKQMTRKTRTGKARLAQRLTSGPPVARWGPARPRIGRVNSMPARGPATSLRQPGLELRVDGVEVVDEVLVVEERRVLVLVGHGEVFDDVRVRLRVLVRRAVGDGVRDRGVVVGAQCPADELNRSPLVGRPLRDHEVVRGEDLLVPLDLDRLAVGVLGGIATAVPDHRHRDLT